METELREALRRLCDEIGWSYAVFWRAIGSPSPKHLVWGDGHWYGKLQPSVSGGADYYVDSELGSQAESIINELVNKVMVPQVHVIGDGIVGQAASTGNHHWILRDVATDRGSVGKYLGDVSFHFLAGIQTIVVVPVLPQGVLQLGSTKRVMENFLFVNHARISFTQLTRELGCFFGVTQKALGRNSLRHDCDSPCSHGFSGVDRSLSIITDKCNHQLSISSASRSFSRPSNNLVAHCNESYANVDPEGNSNFILNHCLKSELVEAQEIYNGDFLSRNEMPFTSVSRCQEQLSSMTSGLCSDSLSLMEGNPLSVRGFNPTVDGIDIAIDSLLARNGTPRNANGAERLISASAIQTPLINLPGMNSLLGQTNRLYGPQGTSLSCHADGLSVNKSQIISTSGNLIKDEDLSPSPCSEMRSENLKECGFESSKTIDANQRIEGRRLMGNLNCMDNKSQNICRNNDPRIVFMPNEKSPSFPLLATSGDDLFDALGIHGDLDGTEASSQVIDFACTTQPSIPSTFDSANDVSSTETFSESNTDQLLDAIVSKKHIPAIHNLYENTYIKTSVTKLSSSPPHCGSSNEGSAASELKQGEYYSHYLLENSAEPGASTSFWSGSSLDTSEKPGFNSEISLRAGSGESMKENKLFISHAGKADEMSKLTKKRPRPGESPRPRPKDRQLIMDRVKELREIVPNGAKCSIDALLEKTIKHMLFLQSVTKHADKLKETREPKIIGKDGAVCVKENFQGGATWAFDVGSQPMTCPIIVEDLNPPREMLVEMLCEERGFFLEIADLIKGLGLTILKGVMEVREHKIWARFAVEANRDVTRMEIFLSLVHLLEPTFGSVAGPHYT
ncbi:Transcription factor LHW [Apostasia shenzhenica]|uniref:Transcription factor LHW n=1 Tax=Apostasia shenzhenica TaxID=1088818 RepID=A0A2I0B165_9ASPA|nr:Transcription factor LHW [Apostasia shenzhenica]